MNTHLSDDLPRLLTGDASHDEVMEAAEHLRTCPDCQQELVSAVVAHASLSSAHRFAPEIVRPDPAPDVTVTPLHAADDLSDDEDGPASPLPDLANVFRQVRDEADHARTAAARRALRSRRGLLAAAAAVVILGGGGTALGLTVGGGGTSGAPIALAAYDRGHSAATAHIKGDDISVDARSLPQLRSNERYEVWLTNDARTSMQSIGFIGDNRTATMTVPKAALAQYSDIEVSVQRADQKQYSKVSVLRGSYS